MVAGDGEAGALQREGAGVVEGARRDNGMDAMRARDRASRVDVHRRVAVGQQMFRVRRGREREEDENDHQRRDRRSVGRR